MASVAWADQEDVVDVFGDVAVGAEVGGGAFLSVSRRFGVVLGEAGAVVVGFGDSVGKDGGVANVLPDGV